MLNIIGIRLLIPHHFKHFKKYAISIDYFHNLCLKLILTIEEINEDEKEIIIYLHFANRHLASLDSYLYFEYIENFYTLYFSVVAKFCSLF